MGIAILALIEITLLYFFSKHLIRSIHEFFMAIFHRQRFSLYLLAFLFVPGTFIHELSHLLVAKLLFVPTGMFTVIPVIEEGQVHLGSVAIAKTDPFRRFLIGVAPIIVGSLALLGFLYLLATRSDLTSWQTILVASVVSFEIGNSMFSSKKDVEGALELGLATTFIVGLLYILGVRVEVPLWVESVFLSLQSSMQVAAQILLVPLLVDTLLIVILRSFLFVFTMHWKRRY